MKNYIKCSILTTLTLVVFIGLVMAPPNIGTTTQASPFEARPTGTAVSASPAPTLAGPFTNTFDGILTTSGTASVAGTTGTVAWVQWQDFQNAPPTAFSITWISVVIKYSHTGTTDDTYNLQYGVGAAPATWTNLTAPTKDKFDYAATPVAQFRAFSKLVEPTDGIWSWTDILNLKVRVFFNRGSTAWDGATKKITIVDVWASVYGTPVPPGPGLTMSIQPLTVSAIVDTLTPEAMFIEVYVNNVVNFGGGQFTINFNTTVLTPTELWLYYPMTDTTVGAQLDDVAGTVALDFSIPVTDPMSPALGGNGFTGSMPVARIYFTVDDENPSEPVGVPPTPNYSPLTFSISFLGSAQAAKLAHGVQHAMYGDVPLNTYLMNSLPLSNPPQFPYATPISTEWVEQFPDMGLHWHLTSFNDKGKAGLNSSDETGMTPIPPGLVKWFQVDQIWECNADPDTFVNMILTEIPSPIPEFPLGITVLMSLVTLIPIAYLWRMRAKRSVNQSGREQRPYSHWQYLAT